jgi:hypothetical protein
MKPFGLEVNTPISRLSAETTDRGEPIFVRRPKALEELIKCIQEIRCLPGFASFQRPLTEQQMKDASKKGNIIIVNITDIRSDAIVFTPSGIRLIPLYRFVALLAQDWINKDLTSPGPPSVKTPAYRGFLVWLFLVWLWRDVVKPILTELDYHIRSLEDLPRV